MDFERREAVGELSAGGIDQSGDSNGMRSGLHTEFNGGHYNCVKRQAREQTRHAAILTKHQGKGLRASQSLLTASPISANVKAVSHWLWTG
jgi:hypothetical protein